MQKPEITELFRYYGNTIWTLEVILIGQIYIPHPSQFNDPFDGSIPFDSNYNPAEFREWAVKYGEREGHDAKTIEANLHRYFNGDGSLSDFAISKIDSASRELDESNKKMRVLCLSEKCDSILMWSHYANKHQGVCIGFAREASSDLGDDAACSPVVCDDTYPKPRFLEIFSDDGRLTHNLFYRKAKGWDYEKEWRLLYEGSDPKTALPSKISRVILGCRCDDTTKALVQAACVAKSIPLFAATQTPGQFSLKINHV